MRFVEQALDLLRRRKKAYVSTFQPGTAAYIAWRDLAKFCHAFEGEGTFNDHDRTLILAGRRQAFWRIYQHVNLEPEELAVLYRAAMIEGD